MQQSPEENNSDIEDHLRNIKKMQKIKKIFGYASIISGIVMITIGLVISGGSIIIPIIGGYLIVNGVVNIFTKLKGN